MRLLIGIALLIFPFGIFSIIVRLWPLAPADLPNSKLAWEAIWPCGFCDTLPFEPRIIVIVLLAGALGSAVHVATSFASYVGSKKFVDSWSWWYLLRMPIGMGLALILYFTLRGGFFSPVSNGENTASHIVNPFGFAAIAALAGMFSKQATDKLKEIFDGLFRTQEDQFRSDKLTDGKPEIIKLDPAEFVAEANERLLKITGTSITDETKVRINDVVRTAVLDQENQLTLTLTPADVARPGILDIQLINPENQGGPSDVREIEIKAKSSNG